MTSVDPTVVLNRVLAILRRSFPQYLRYARPYIPAGNRRATEVIDDIVLTQDALAERVGEQIMASGGLPDSGAFPIEFTDTHDLGIDYLISEAMGYQKQDIAELESHADAPQLPTAARSLVSEALGMAKGHLESLEELQATRGDSTIVRNGEPEPSNDQGG